MNHGIIGSLRHREGFRRDTRFKGYLADTGTGRGTGHHRFVRFRQDHPAALPELSGAAGHRCHQGERRDHVGRRRPRHPAGERGAQKAAALRAGVPELQPVPAVYGIAERDAGRGAAGQGAAGLQGQQKGHPRPAGAAGPGTSGPDGPVGAGGPLPASAVRRPAAARGHCPRPGPAPGYPLLRRAYQRAGPGADRRGAARSAGPCRPQDHHDHRDPRDELCP